MKYAEFIERKKHGSPEFPIQHYLVNKNHPQYFMRSHWHREFEIIRVMRGVFNLHLNNCEYTLEGGDIIFAPGTCLHSGVPKNCVYECFVFDAGMLCANKNLVIGEFFSSIANSRASFKNLIDRDDTEIHTLISHLSYAMTKKEALYELDVYSILYKFFSHLYNKGYITLKEKSSINKQTEAILGLIDWIEKNFTEQISLDTLSQVSGFTKKYLCRIFKEYTSKTPIEYINELRIENAASVMSRQGATITDAAFESGFNDLSYFCKIFKRVKGISPGQYKKEKNAANS